MKQVERRIVFPQQIIGDDIVPDKIAPAQHVERGGHIASVQIARFAELLDQFHMLVAGKQQQVAGFFEIDLGGEERGGGNLVGLAALGQQCQRGGQRGAGNAIADGMDILDVQRIAYAVDRVDLRGDIIVPHHIGHGGIGRFPADHEQGDPLIHRPFDEALLFVEVEDVEAVDPWGEDDQRRFQHLFRARRILDQLIERRFLHDLAGRRRDVHAQLERIRVRMRKLPLAQIFQHMFQPLQQAFSARLIGAFQNLRIGQREIGRRYRVEGVGQVEPQLGFCVRVQPVDIVSPGQHALRREMIGLRNRSEDGVIFPAFMPEAFVLRLGRLRPAIETGSHQLAPIIEAGCHHVRLLAHGLHRIDRVDAIFGGRVGTVYPAAHHAFRPLGQRSIGDLFGGEFGQKLLGAQRHETPLLHLFKQVLRALRQIGAGLFQRWIRAVFLALVRHDVPLLLRRYLRVSNPHNIK